MAIPMQRKNNFIIRLFDVRLIICQTLRSFEDKRIIFQERPWALLLVKVLVL